MYTGGKTYAPDSQRVTTLFVHDASPLEVMNGTSTGLEITRFARSVKQSANECTIGLAWHDELYGANQPTAGRVLEIRLEGASYWIGIIQAVNDYRLSSGEKSLSIVARSRDATPAWRDVKRATDVFPTATPLAYIAKQIAQALGLTTAEIQLPDAGASTVHSNTQLADISPWSMLGTLYQPSGLEPYVDCRGRLKCISREIRRVSDIVLSDNRRLIDVSGSKSKLPLTEMRIKWLDPHLTESAQQDRMLERASITAGFFKLKQERLIYFSGDQTQRARDTHMVIRQTANAGLLHFCSEDYAQETLTSGRITVTTSVWAPLLANAALAHLFAAGFIPDGVYGTTTVPIGKIVHVTAEVAMLLIMMCIGTGQYEIWGTPFTYVHARNTTSAFNQAAKVWEIQPQEIENDFVMNEAQAQTFSIRELIYAARSAASYNISIVDDTRIERGDIIQLVDGSRVYVTDYARDLSSGAPAVLQVSGFRADASAISVGAPVVIDDGGAGGLTLVAPSVRTAPVISGGTSAGTTLYRTVAVWDGVPAPTIVGGWYRNGLVIAGETGADYTTQNPGDVGKDITWVETGTSAAGGPITTQSNAITVVATVATGPAFTSVPIVHAATEGVPASYIPAPYTGTAPVTVTHDWLLDAVSQGTSFTPAVGDATKTLTIQETLNNAYGGPITSGGLSAGVTIATGLPSGGVVVKDWTLDADQPWIDQFADVQANRVDHYLHDGDIPEPGTDFGLGGGYRIAKVADPLGEKGTVILLRMLGSDPPTAGATRTDILAQPPGVTYVDRDVVWYVGDHMIRSAQWDRAGNFCTLLDLHGVLTNSNWTLALRSLEGSLRKAILYVLFDSGPWPEYNVSSSMAGDTWMRIAVQHKLDNTGTNGGFLKMWVSLNGAPPGDPVVDYVGKTASDGDPGGSMKVACYGGGVTPPAAGYEQYVKRAYTARDNAMAYTVDQVMADL